MKIATVWGSTVFSFEDGVASLHIRMLPTRFIVKKSPEFISLFLDLSNFRTMLQYLPKNDSVTLVQQEDAKKLSLVCENVTKEKVLEYEINLLPEPTMEYVKWQYKSYPHYFIHIHGKYLLQVLKEASKHSKIISISCNESALSFNSVKLLCALEEVPFSMTLQHSEKFENWHDVQIGGTMNKRLSTMIACDLLKPAITCISRCTGPIKIILSLNGPVSFHFTVEDLGDLEFTIMPLVEK